MLGEAHTRDVGGAGVDPATVLVSPAREVAVMVEFEQPASGRSDPLAQVLAAVRVGTITPHQPATTRRRLRDQDVFQDLAEADQVLTREQAPAARARCHVPATGR